jgi:two-component system, LytTR family, sensor kinase
VSYFYGMSVKFPYQNRVLVPVIHAMFWMLLFVLPYLLRLSSTGSRMSDMMQYRLLFNNCVLVLLFYLNANFLYPVI